MPEGTLHQTMAGLPLFAGMTEPELTDLAASTRVSSIPGRTLLMSLEQPGEVVYVIVEGTLRVQAEQEDGSLVVLAFLGPGDLVGEMSLLEVRDRRHARAVPPRVDRPRRVRARARDEATAGV